GLVPRIDSDTVDGVGREAHHTARPDRLNRPGNRLGHVVTTAYLGRPLRSACTATRPSGAKISVAAWACVSPISHTIRAPGATHGFAVEAMAARTSVPSGPAMRARRGSC